MKVKNTLNSIVVLVNGVYQKQPGEEFVIHKDHKDHPSVLWGLERNWITVLEDEEDGEWGQPPKEKKVADPEPAKDEAVVEADKPKAKKAAKNKAADSAEATVAIGDSEPEKELLDPQ